MWVGGGGWLGAWGLEGKGQYRLGREGRGVRVYVCVVSETNYAHVPATALCDVYFDPLEFGLEADSDVEMEYRSSDFP